MRHEARMTSSTWALSTASFSHTSQGGDFQRPWKRCSMVAKWPLEVEIAMGKLPVPISVSSGHFALRYEVPKFLPTRGHLCTRGYRFSISLVTTLLFRLLAYHYVQRGGGGIRRVGIRRSPASTTPIRRSPASTTPTPGLRHGTGSEYQRGTSSRCG